MALALRDINRASKGHEVCPVAVPEGFVVILREIALRHVPVARAVAEHDDLGIIGVIIKLAL